MLPMLLGTNQWIAFILTILGILFFLRSYSFHYPKRNFQNQVILISGAANGIGRGLAHKLASNGAILILFDINSKGLKQVKNELKSITAVHTYVCDVSNPQLVQETIKQAQTDIAPQHIDVVVNNAGVVSGKPFLQLEPSDVQRTFAINTMSHFWMNQAILPSMIRQKKGFIVTISSVMSLIGSAGLSDYSASKWAVTGFHESLRLELRKLKFQDQIKTLLVCPYAINTGMFNGIFDDTPIVQALVPVLEPRDVVDRIFNAMQHEDQILIGCAGGWHQYVFPWLPIILHSLPTTLMDSLIRLLGGCNGMDKFTGHHRS